jgi:hypothetical protein
MYLAGPLASMLIPSAFAVWFAYRELNAVGWVLVLISIANIVFTAYFSPKEGCIAKARRAIRRAKLVTEVQKID